MSALPVADDKRVLVCKACRRRLHVMLGANLVCCPAGHMQPIAVSCPVPATGGPFEGSMANLLGTWPVEVHISEAKED